MKSKTQPALYLSARAWAFVLIVTIGGFAHTPVAMAGGQPAAQVNREGPVQVKVTPRSLAVGATVWEFEVAFNTHTVPIDGDPAQFSVLVDGRENTHAALAWIGDPPGGHHRKGVLQFRPFTEPKGAVELRINGVGGVATRAFRWERD